MPTGISGSKPSVREGEVPDIGPRSSQGSSDRSKKSILKHRDPETEQLIPTISTDSPIRKNKTPTPVKFVGVSDDEKDEISQRKRLPRSPLPSRKPPRAPLEDLLADFEDQENGQRPENRIINDALLDQQNANTEFRCSRQNCKLNSPAQTSSVIQDPLIAPYCLPLCICGAPMTRIPVYPTSEISVISGYVGNLTNPTEPTISVSTTNEMGTELDQSWPSSTTLCSTDKALLNGRNGRGIGRNGRTPENRLQAENLNNEDDILFADDILTEETKLIERPPFPRGTDKQPK